MSIEEQKINEEQEENPQAQDRQSQQLQEKGEAGDLQDDLQDNLQGDLQMDTDEADADSQQAPDDQAELEDAEEEEEEDEDDDDVEEEEDGDIEDINDTDEQGEVESGIDSDINADMMEASKATDQSAEEAEAAAEVQPKPKRKRKTAKGKELEPEKPVTILHMVFDEPGGEQIRQSFELEPANTGEIIYIEDNYSLGPVADLAEAEGWQLRKGWWQSVLGLDPEVQPEVMTSDKMKLHQLLQRLEEQQDTVLWIWMGQNERDVAGYFYIISHLMEFQGRIQVLYLNNLPFIDEKGHIFYPKQLSEILPKEFVKAARLARVVTLSEFELDPEEWDKLSRLPGSVRLLEGGKKLAVRENDYYDKIILDQLGSATMKLSRLLGLLSTKAKLGLPEYYIIWRIQSMIETGQVISQGEFEKGAKNVSLKATQGQMFVEMTPDEGEDVGE